MKEIQIKDSNNQKLTFKYISEEKIQLDIEDNRYILDLEDLIVVLKFITMEE